VPAERVPCHRHPGRRPPRHLLGDDSSLGTAIAEVLVVHEEGKVPPELISKTEEKELYIEGRQLSVVAPDPASRAHTPFCARASALAHWLAYAKPSGPPAASRAYAGPSAVAGQTALRPALRIRCGPVHTLINRQFRRNERVALLVQRQSKAMRTVCTMPL
jgi:hypothetical protein